MGAKKTLKSFLRKFGVDVQRYQPERDPRNFLRNQGIRSVLDIGANVGKFALEMRQMFPQAVIHCFEPLPECRAELAACLGNDPKVRVFPCALGRKDEVAQIHRSTYSPASSLLPMQSRHKDEFPFAVESEKIDVQVRRLDGLAGELDILSPLLVKIDVQGFETRVLSGGADVIRRADVIVIEMSLVRLYEGGGDFHDVYTQIRGLGFNFSGILGQLTSPKDGTPLQIDGLFLKPPGDHRASPTGVPPGSIATTEKERS